MSPLLVTLLTILGASLAFAGVYLLATDLFLRDRIRVRQRLEEEFSSRATLQAKKLPLFKNLEKFEKFGPDGAIREDRVSVRERFAIMVEQSGLEATPAKILLIGAVIGLAIGLAVALVSKMWWLGAALAPVGAVLPVAYVRFKRNQRLEKLMSQMPDVFELIARLVRAGQTTSQAFQGVAQEFQPPIAAEFAKCYEQQNLGLSPESALRDMARRIDLVEMKIFILAVLVQRQTGGNLAELIDNLAAIVRDRYKIRGKIRVLTAEGRMEAAVLLALPPIVFLLILFLNRNYGEVLLRYPSVLYGMVGFMLVGIIWIRKIINFDF